MSSTPKGSVYISGAKNAIIPLLCTSILAKGKVFFRNVPRISDVYDLCNILKYLNCKVLFKRHSILIDNTNLIYKPLLLDECKKIRGSYYFIGPFLTLFSKCEILLPGGCKIGNRPIDIHLKGFLDLGYKYKIEENKLIIYKNKTILSANIKLKKQSVGASINLVLGCLGLNECVINNTLFEPEGLDVLLFLKKIGYYINLNNNTLYYKKSNIEFINIKHNVIFDRMEAMTYTVLGLLKGDLIIKKVNTKYIKIPLEILKEAGFNISYTDNQIFAKKSYGKNINIKTDIYPGFPTDLQPIFGVLMLNTLGVSRIEETIYENRMQIYYDLKKCGTICNIDGNLCEISGFNKKNINELEACDLRHGAALMLFAIFYDDDIIIKKFEYILRGYDDILNKLKSIGIKIQII